LDHPHVVAPDIGTSSTLFAAAANPGRFRSLVDYMVCFAGAGHFCWEEKPDEHASLVAQWWQENSR
jgi:hypothetical protein